MDQKDLSCSDKLSHVSQSGEEQTVCEESLQVLPEFSSDTSNLRKTLQAQLKSLQKKHKRVKTAEKTYEEVLRHSQHQVEECEAHITALFHQLHQLLQQEETRAMEALREEQRRQAQTVTPELGRIREELTSLELSIREIEEQLQKDNCEMPQGDMVKTLLIQPNQKKLGPEVLMNQAKVLGNLGFKVCEKMRVFHYSPVILDPNTASGWLQLSPDLTTVRRRRKAQQVPENPERFITYSLILGSESFTKPKHKKWTAELTEGQTGGKYVWDVEVGDHPCWTLGVVSDTVDRKAEAEALPQNGFWCMGLNNGEYYNVEGNTVKFIGRSKPRRIRVHLNLHCKKKVVFLNAETMDYICGHRGDIAKTLFPFVSVGDAGDAHTQDIRFCSSQMSLDK